MLSSLAVLGGAFAWSIARAYRRQRLTPGSFQPAGKLRWSDSSEEERGGDSGGESGAENEERP